MLERMKIKQKLLAAFFVVGVIPALIIAYTSVVTSNRALEKTEYSKLETLRESKKNQLSDFFENQKKELEILKSFVQTYEDQGHVELGIITKNKENKVIDFIGAIKKETIILSQSAFLKSVLKESSQIVSSLNDSENIRFQQKYKQFIKKVSPRINEILNNSEFEEVYLIDPKSGLITYASGEGKEIGVNLINTNNSNSVFTEIRSKVLQTNKLFIKDFIEYKYTNNEQKMFLAAPSFDKNGEIESIVVTRYGKDKINFLLSDTSGLGETGDTYLAGKEGSKLELRSDVKKMKNSNYVVGYEFTENTPEYWYDAFAGKNIDEVYTDSAGKLVMISGGKLHIEGLDWIIITKKDLEEIVTKRIENKDIYSIFMNKFNFNDLYLIHPQGDVFYSVAKGGDYHSNIINGQFARSGLAKLVKKIKKSGQYEVEDFSKYRPNQENVTQFIGLPYIKDGKIEMILAAQINIKKINEIVKHMNSMGETGELVLVGEDLKMRSNSHLDFANRSVKASFDKGEEGNIQTKDVINALNGKSKTVEMEDYLGNKVISSYSNIDINGTKWAIVAKMNSKEVRESITKLSFLILAILLVSLILIMVFALHFAGLISKPILSLNDWAQKVTKGENEVIEIETTKDEIGMVVTSFKQVVRSLREITSICEEIAIGDLTHHFDERGENDVLGQSINKMRKSFLEVVAQSKRVAKGDYSVELKEKSSKDELSDSLNQMILSLRDSRESESKQRWTKTGQAELSEIMQGDQKIDDLTSSIIKKLCQYMNAEVGTFFVSGPENTFRLISSYAFTKRKNYSNVVSSGEGLVGQALLEKQLIILNHLPSDYMCVSSSTGDSSPSNLAIIPCIYNNEVKAIIEIGKLGEFSDTDKEFLKLVSSNIAVGIHSTEAQEEMKNLLEKTLTQAEELQVQQEELRVSNEELEEQAKALKRSEENLKQQQEELRQTNKELERQTVDLKESEEKLQAQQEELRVTNEELEERTEFLEKQRSEINEKNEVLELAQVEIEKKARDLEVASKYKSEFLANMSHELRTPLNSILILSQLLSGNKNENLSENEIEFANTINSAGTDLLNLINDILDLSKVEAGKMEITIEEFSVKSFMQNIERTFIPVAEDKGLELKLELADDIVEKIKCDEQRLSQIIKNLMSNALKFTEKGQVTFKAFNPKNLNIHVKSLENTPAIAFSVLDTGVGISEEKLSHIFEAFKQADGTTSRKYGGTGLGLSITREFVRLFGGEIQVKSVEGEGSEFIVILPIETTGEVSSEHIFNATEYIESNFGTFKDEIKVEKITEGEIIEEPKVVMAPLNQLPNIDKENDYSEYLDFDINVSENDYILIIEDDKNFSSLINSIAKEKGFESIVVNSGEKGLAVAKKVTPAAIILDIGLPGINGWEVLDKIKLDRKLKKVPVHIMSAEDKKSEYKNLGILDYIQKPVSVEKLNSTLNGIKKLINCDIKRILIAENDETHSASMQAFLSSQGEYVDIVSVPTAEETMKLLKEKKFDCMILDLGLDDMSGMDLLTKIRKEDISQIPIIIYTGKELSMKENESLQRYAETVIIKGPDSIDRLLDETNLFIHHIEKKVREKKQRMVKSEYEKEATLAGKEVLVVDDDMRNVFALTNLLESKGVTVEVAKNGKLALDAVGEKSFDAILMDIMMPEMDGYTATRAIRKLPKYDNIPIIALTAKAMKEDKNKCISAGASDYMSKPINGDKLLNLLRVWLY